MDRTRTPRRTLEIKPVRMKPMGQYRTRQFILVLENVTKKVDRW
jgi:hypothetical protein